MSNEDISKLIFAPNCSNLDVDLHKKSLKEYLNKIHNSRNEIQKDGKTRISTFASMIKGNEQFKFLVRLFNDIEYNGNIGNERSYLILTKGDEFSVFQKKTLEAMENFEIFASNIFSAGDNTTILSFHDEVNHNYCIIDIDGKTNHELINEISQMCNTDPVFTFNDNDDYETKKMRFVEFFFREKVFYTENQEEIFGVNDDTFFSNDESKPNIKFSFPYAIENIYIYDLVFNEDETQLFIKFDKNFMNDGKEFGDDDLYGIDSKYKRFDHPVNIYCHLYNQKQLLFYMYVYNLYKSRDSDPDLSEIKIKTFYENKLIELNFKFFNLIMTKFYVDLYNEDLGLLENYIEDNKKLAYEDIIPIITSGKPLGGFELTNINDGNGNYFYIDIFHKFKLELYKGIRQSNTIKEGQHDSEFQRMLELIYNYLEQNK